jgi:hypothetical protein
MISYIYNNALFCLNIGNIHVKTILTWIFKEIVGLSIKT